MTEKKYYRVICITIFSIAAFALSSCAARTKPISTGNGIASLEEVKLGGIKQWILIRGQDSSNPVLLFLHGGPGSTEMPVMQHYNGELERDFVVVSWDQRGAGKSDHASIPKESMNIDQFVRDGHELTLILKKRFNVPRIFLVGHSWGTVLGVKLAQEFPGDYYAYVAIGQVVNGLRNEEVSYQFVLDEAKKRGDKKAARKMEKIGRPPYSGMADMAYQRHLLQKYGGAMDSSYKELFSIALRSPEYNLLDFIKWLHGNYRSDKLMEDQVMAIDFFTAAPRLNVPVYFFEGRHDYNTPWPLVEEYYEKLDAPKGKQLVWFENSAHAPNFNEPQKYAAELRRVKQETCYQERSRP